MAENEQSLPIGESKPSKGALKAMEKAKKKAEQEAKRAEEEAKRKAEAEANDTAKHLYGKIQDGLAPAQTEKLVPIEDLAKHAGGQQVTVQARVHNARAQSAKLAFLDLRQPNGSIQAVIAEGGPHGISRLMVKWCSKLNRESVVLAAGVLEEPKEPVQSATVSNLELHIQSCFVTSEGPMQLALQVKDAMRPLPVGEDTQQVADQQPVDAAEAPVPSLATRLDNRVLDLRTPLNHAIFAINDAVEDLFREFMRTTGFRKVQTPKLVGAATEGGSNVFSLNYFGSPAFLSQSPQFFKQMLISSDFERVFEVGPVFRAENSNTPRHLTEFTGLDFEMRIYKSWTEVVDVAEDLMLFIFRGLQERCERERRVVQHDYPEAGNFQLPEGKAPRLRFAEGIKMLNEAGIEVSAEEDINTTNEKTLGKLVKEKYGTDFYILTHYPVAARPFYTHVATDDPGVTHSYDAFVRGQEIVSGAQRIHDPETLMKRMRSMEPPLDPESEGFKHYLDAFRNGCGPHGGGGFGLNRITMLWLGLPNIRQATLFPRDPQRKAP